MNRHRRDVLQLNVATGRHLDAELGQHVVEGLHGERRLGGLVTATVQADNQAVADQLVTTNTMDGRDILQTLGLCASTEREQTREQKQFFPHDISSGQKGHIGLMKNRSSQPGWLASAKAPVPE